MSSSARAARAARHRDCQWAKKKCPAHSALRPRAAYKGPLFFLNPLSGVCSFLKAARAGKIPRRHPLLLLFRPHVALLRANAQTALLHEPGTAHRSRAIPNPLSGVCSSFKLQERAKNRNAHASPPLATPAYQTSTLSARTHPLPSQDPFLPSYPFRATIPSQTLGTGTPGVEQGVSMAMRPASCRHSSPRIMPQTSTLSARTHPLPSLLPSYPFRATIPFPRHLAPVPLG